MTAEKKRINLSRVKRTTQVGGGSLASEAGTATRVGTRRSWLAGVGALFAATAVSPAKTLGSPSAAPGLPPSIWPYQAPGMQFVLEAPRGRYEWLNQALYVGTLNPLPQSEHAVVVRFFKVT